MSLDGKLVGINTAILSRSGGSSGVGFAIPSDMVKPIMDSLLKYRKVRRGWLGVAIQNVDADIAKAMSLPKAEGVLISDVVGAGAGAKAGLKRGDVVLRIDGEPVKLCQRAEKPRRSGRLRCEAQARHLAERQVGGGAGVAITNVARGSDAEHAGLRSGDVATELDRRPVNSTDDFERAWRAAGRAVLLLVYRDGRTMFVVVHK